MSRPYSLYVHKRPLRTAFIVDKATADLQLLTRIATFSQQQWGGRFNPIILTDGLTISKADWSLLRGIDPDIVKALVPLAPELIQRLEDRLSPYLLEAVKEVSDNPLSEVPTLDQGLWVPPTTKNLGEVFSRLGHSSDERMRLAMFAVTKKTDPLLDHFVQHNFGMYTNPDLVARSLNEEGGNVVPFVFEIEDKVSLATHLLTVSESTKWIYPVQLQTSSADIRERQERLHVDFSVIVGDTPEDVTLAWNHPIHLPGWQRRQLRSLWIPTSLATDPDMMVAMRSWIRNLADPWRQGNKTVQFVSQSHGPEALNDIAKTLTHPGLWPLTQVVTQPSELTLEGYAPHLRNRSELQLYRGFQETEHFDIPGPDHPKQSAASGKWMADLFIIMDGNSSSEQATWVKLPPRNRLAQCMFERPSRVKLDGMASVLMSSDDPDVRVRLLASEEIFRILITLENTPCYTLDARSQMASKPFPEVRRSDKGRYLSGVIDLFGSLGGAHGFLEERYWRNIFGLMSQKDPSADQALLGRIKNRLAKELRGSPEDFADKPTSIQRLAEYVLTLAREHGPTGNALPYARLLELARAETADLGGSSMDPAPVVDVEDLREDITELLSRNILLAGIHQKCEFCGTTSWYHVDEVHQSVRCPGCGQWEPLQVEPEWNYKLNSLVQAAIARHGLVPVLLVLGELHRWTASFSYDTCLELISDDGKSFGDLDVVALVDGELVIGEIKQSINLFKPSDFSKMATIAERLKPSRVIFSSMCEQSTARVETQIAALRETLQDQGTQVLWYQLPQFIFSPSEM